MTTTFKNLNERTELAKLISEMGFVDKDEQGSNVKSPTHSNEIFRVWRTKKGYVCNCSDFEKQSQEDPGFQCEHILAVDLEMVLFIRSQVTLNLNNPLLEDLLESDFVIERNFRNRSNTNTFEFWQELIWVIFLLLVLVPRGKSLVPRGYYFLN